MGVLIKGPKTKGKLFHSEVWGGVPYSECLVSIDDGAEAILEGNTIRNGNNAGVIIGGMSNCVLQSNKIYGNKGAGIVVRGSGCSTLIKNTIRDHHVRTDAGLIGSGYAVFVDSTSHGLVEVREDNILLRNEKGDAIA